MNATIKLAVLAALGISGPFLARPVAALDAAAAPDSDTLETIIVTAEKRSESLQNVPMSVTALGGGTLDNLQAKDFSDYMSMVPGLSLQSTQPGYTRLTLRGQNAGGVGSTVAVYVDESPFGSSSALLDGSIISGDFDTWDLQRIEVLRGPQGTLYGANSEGGLLKFVTNAPELGTFSGAVETTGEGVDHGGLGGDLRVMLNLPLGDRAALRVSGFDDVVAGYIDDPSTGKSEVNNGHKYGGRVSLLLDPTDDISIRLTAASQESNYSGTNAVDINPVTFQPVHGDLTQERYFGEPSTFVYNNYNATIDWNVGPFSILSTTSYGVLNSNVFTDYTSTVLAPPSTTLGDLLTEAVAPGLGASLQSNADLSKVTQEIRLASPSSTLLEWQVGGYFTREIGYLSQYLTALSLPTGAAAGLPSLETVALDSTYKEYAGFANVTYHISSQFDVQVGGRYSKNEQTVFESLSGLLVGPGTSFSVPSSGDVFTYSVAPTWHIDANNMIYARLATGYRPGGPNALPPIAPPDVPREYGADKTVNTEIGIRSTLLDQHLSIDLAIFHVSWKDIQLLEQVDNTGINGNGGTAKSQGVEWTFGYLPVTGLKFTWVGAYTDAYLTSPAPAVNGVSGDPLPYAPKWGTSLDGEYDWAAFADYKWFAGAMWSYVGARRTDFGSSVSLTEQVALPSYNTYEARIGLDNDRYRVTLYGKNLSDSRGITGYFSSGAPGLAGEATITQPRTIGVTLSAKF